MNVSTYSQGEGASTMNKHEQLDSEAYFAELIANYEAMLIRKDQRIAELQTEKQRLKKYIKKIDQENTV